MAIVKGIIPALTVCATAGVLVIASAPALGAGKPIDEPAAAPVVKPVHEPYRPPMSCMYQVVKVRPSSFLNVRQGPGLRYRPVGELTVADGRFVGACGVSHGWVALTSSSGKLGWASAGYLYRIPTPHPSLVRRPALSCSYRVANVRRGGHLQVRKGPGLTYEQIGTLDETDGRFAGACSAWRGWVAVTTSGGLPGWASSRYLKK
ncbi:hypothetical protein GCM10023194_79680 [Planotetraspora phitsanulokensis]|uniref:SH3b domain-containing protein n=1 Tax=Planotetraspora phitsanulokensis TaxID=575192 RepID=A0A8J3XMG0_9ACTN|nr:hypothetical protein [Planotetraspora phitsanulokensis]GII41703.1 hypothetical protein Pph01_67060 [Planotetraspora phitsanulokensis]